MSDNKATDAEGNHKQIVSRKTVFISFGILFSILFAVFGGIWVCLSLVVQNESLMSKLALRPAVGSEDYDLSVLAGIERKSVFVPAKDSSKLQAWVFLVPGASKIVLVNHGNAGNNANRLYLASALTKPGMNVVLYDYRGYGISTGTPTLKGILEDGDTMYNYVQKELKYSPQQIVLYGESIGTAVTCHVASEHKCAGVILQSPICSLPDAARFVFLFLRLHPDSIFAKPHLNNLELVSKIHCPILIMHGQRDSIVSANNSQLLYDASNEPKTLVFLPNCGHNDMGLHDTSLYTDAVAKFVSSLH